MNFATFVHNDIQQGGIYINGGYYPLHSILNERNPIGILQFINAYEKLVIPNFLEIISQKKLQPLTENQVMLCSPIPKPLRSVICVGKNYEDHAKEVSETMQQGIGDNFVPTEPIYFAKSAYHCVGDNETVPVHSQITNKLDYEVELAVIIGKTISCISEDKVGPDVIFGYTVLNDITARDIQMKHNQWFFGKSLDNTCAIGPYITTKDEISFPPELDIKCYVNGELRQSSNTSNFIFSIQKLISQLSFGITLRPGDIIATGTPAGIGHALKPPSYLKNGDKVICEIQNIGKLTNIIK